MNNYQKILEAINYESITIRIDPTERLVADYERKFKTKLPAAYRAFLISYGGIWVSATCPIQEPCPCGSSACLQSFYGFMPPERVSDDIRWQTEIFQGAPVIVPIAESGFGSMISLKCEGDDAGTIYFFDGEQRFFWPDEQFHGMFENLAPEISVYLSLRKERKLPKKPRNYENFYRIAPNFDEFLMACKPEE